MLILTRKTGEALVTNNDITVTIMGVTGAQIRLGVNAPEEIKVHREEIHNRIAQEKNQDD